MAGIASGARQRVDLDRSTKGARGFLGHEMKWARRELSDGPNHIRHAAQGVSEERVEDGVTGVSFPCSCP